MWIEIPKKCETRECKEEATHFFTRWTLVGTKWGFFCKAHAIDADRKPALDRI